MLLNCGVGKNFESPLDYREIQLVHPKGNQSWIFIGKTDAKAGTPIIWPPDVKKWFIWKDPHARKDWRREEKGTTEDEMVGWHHQLDGHEFGQALGIDDGQRSLACCSPWGCKEFNMTEPLNWLTDLEVNLTTVLKDLCNENYKTFLKEIKETWINGNTCNGHGLEDLLLSKFHTIQINL